MSEAEPKVFAKKFDHGKLMFSLFPRSAQIEIVKVLTYGAIAYGPGNWKEGEGFDWQRLQDALERHYIPWCLGEDCDPDSGLLHLAHLGCCLMFALDHQVNNHGYDTRSRSQLFRKEAGTSITMALPSEVLEKALEKKRKGEAAAAEGKAFQSTGGKSQS